MALFVLGGFKKHRLLHGLNELGYNKSTHWWQRFFFRLLF
jgi:hypothetical protein